MIHLLPLVLMVYRTYICKTFCAQSVRFPGLAEYWHILRQKRSRFFIGVIRMIMADYHTLQKVGEINDNDEQGAFVDTIVTQDGSLVEKVLIDKQTGWMKRQY